MKDADPGLAPAPAPAAPGCVYVCARVFVRFFESTSTQESHGRIDREFH